jgi:hypothetical protein
MGDINKGVATKTKKWSTHSSPPKNKNKK